MPPWRYNIPIGQSAKTFKSSTDVTPEGSEGAQPAAVWIKALLTRYGLHNTTREIRLVTEWYHTVGERIAAHAFPVGLKQGILYLHATHAGWQHELSFVQNEIIEKINHFVGDPPLVNTLRWTSRYDPPPDTHEDLVALLAAQHHRKFTPPNAANSPSMVSPETHHRIHDETAVVVDVELRESIREFRMRWGV